jgi:TetR/AcrR family transcriptional repressor of mexJK operon
MMSLVKHVKSPSGIYLRKNARRKYDAILKSASRLFLKHGYTRTSMDTVAADAGVSKQTVYSYFKNKDVLFCQMIEEECVRHDTPETLLSNTSLSPEEALYHIGLSYQELILSHRALAIHRLVIAEAERHPRIAQLFFDSGPLRMRAVVVKFLERHSSALTLSPSDVDKVAKHYLNMIKGGYHFRMLLRLKPVPSKKELEDHVRHMTQMFFKLYGK